MQRIIVLLVAVIISAVLGSATAASAQGGNYCNFPPPRLVVGQQARVTPGLPNVIRSQPWRGPTSEVVGYIPAGAVFTVLGGYNYQCSDGINWYYITYNGFIGWTPEGNAGVYWTEPLTSNSCALTNRLLVGDQGRVSPGLPNVLRNQPWRGAGSQIIGLIPAGGLFHVTSGPQCNNGILWLQVNYNGIVGWTGEGEAGNYWLEPATGGNPGTCVGALMPNLTVGASAYVPNGFSVGLYPQASALNNVMLWLPGGSWVRVLSSPLCVGGVNWWQVRFNNYEGWVQETVNNQYVLQPYVCPGFMPSRLVVGSSARVTPGTPNNLRAQPTLNAQIIGTIPGGQSMAVVGGPQCGNNGAWWQVAVNGVYGWTMEGRNNTYYLEPF